MSVLATSTWTTGSRPVHHGSVGATDRSGDHGDVFAVPGVYPGAEGAPAIASFTMEVDGEIFASRPAEHGGTDYMWLNGPNEGYGFGSSGPLDRPMDEHRES